MPSIHVEIKNLDRFLAAMSKSPRTVATHIHRAVDRAGHHFLAAVKQNIRTGRGMYKPPIDTGYMWNNIFLNVFPLKAVITPTANYAVYVHEGTSRMQSRPYLNITEESETNEVEKIFSDELNSAMNEIARGF